MFFNLSIVLFVWVGGLFYCPEWCKLILLVFLAGGFYFGIVFGFSSLFNQTKKRLFGIVAFIGHLISLIMVSYFIFMLMIEFLGMIFFGVDMTATQNQYTAKEKFQIVLLLETVPSSVHDLKVTGAIQGWLTSISMQYKTDKQFFDMLAQRKALKNASEWDTPIHKTSCRKKYSSPRICYLGVVFPFVHDIAYNPKTKEVEHEVTGMRN